MSKRAINGAKLLDELCPGWDAIIDLETLDVYSHDKCILAQLGKSPLGDPLRNLFIDESPDRMMKSLLKHGLFCMDSRSGARMTDAWKKLITARRLNTPRQPAALSPS